MMSTYRIIWVKYEDSGKVLKEELGKFTFPELEEEFLLYFPEDLQKIGMLEIGEEYKIEDYPTGYFVVNRIS